MRLRLTIFIAVAAVIATGCSGEDQPGTSTSTTTAGPAATITIESFSFGDPVSVPAGSTVLVDNADLTAHTWTATDGTFNSGNLNPGETFEFTFAGPGEHAFFCSIHTSMAGTITVTG